MNNENRQVPDLRGFRLIDDQVERSGRGIDAEPLRELLAGPIELCESLPLAPARRHSADEPVLKIPKLRKRKLIPSFPAS